jgi:anhydro-N-acetylmuramic acid kinase
MSAMRSKAMVVAGVMSGTSADGVDVALCRISDANDETRIKLLGSSSFPYSKRLRDAVLAAMDAPAMAVADMSRLHWRLGEIYADAIEATVKTARARLDLVGCHGQTIYHQGSAQKYLGKDIRCTWQIGEASVIAERLRVPVISDFRPADLAAGGQAAPLVPMLDYTLLRSTRVHRVLQNLGGIANLTAIPAAGSTNDVLAFDTGPANMVIDACMTRLYNRGYDRDGAVARRGKVLQAVVERLLREHYFRSPPPKSCGREQYGEGFTTRFIDLCRKAKAKDADVIATATALTAQSIIDAYDRFVVGHLARKGKAKIEYVVAGGGARNATLMEMLRDGLTKRGAKLRTTDDLGIPAQSKEAMAFALLAWMTWMGKPGNIPSATGAARSVVLGKATFG